MRQKGPGQRPVSDRICHSGCHSASAAART
jgi:hypothetical protein